MHHGHQPARTAEGTDTHHGDYYYEHQECKDVAKLKLVYNKNNHELSIHSSRGETQSNKKNKLKIKRIVDKNERIDKIKSMPIPSLKDVKHRPFIPAKIKPLITPDMYMKPRDRYGFSPPDELG